MRLLLLLLLFTTFVNAQNKKIEKLKQQTVEIAYILYKSELASWHSTDVLQAEYKHRMSELGGYLSYIQGENTRAIYYDKSPEKNIIFSVEFPDVLKQKERYVVDTLLRESSELELRLIKARDTARDIAYNDENDYFKFYENSNYNFVPIIHKGKVVVYSLTGPTVSGSVLIGNDYKYEFDEEDGYVSSSKMHNSLIAHSYTGEDGKTLEMVLHTHSIKEYPIITETDLCTLLMYRDYVEWNQSIIIGDDYVSIWQMDKEELTILTRKAWDKIYQD